MYERNERLNRHRISQMEQVSQMSSFEYEPLNLSREPYSSDEEENRGDIDGVGPSNTRAT
jgi:hypothetical protein